MLGDDATVTWELKPGYVVAAVWWTGAGYRRRGGGACGRSFHGGEGPTPCAWWCSAMPWK
ncbi:MAG: hypothetical protein ACLSGS_09620 [Adlercreutzia sp.]